MFAASLSGNWELFVSIPDGSDVRQLTHTTIDQLSPAISPDGLRVVYATSDGALWTMTLVTHKAGKLPLPPGRYAHPTWLPDGSGIVFTSYVVHPPDEDSDLYVYIFKEGKKKLFLKQNGPQDYPAISPDGNKLAYMCAFATLIPGMEGIINQQLWVADLRAGKAAPLFLTAARDRHPAWAPDGRRLAFSSDRNGQPDIWVTDLESHETQQLTNDPASATTPAWSPDGKEIVYVSTSSGRSELMIVNVETRATRKVLPFGSRNVEVRDPRWR
jgi:TolB protein